MSTKLSNNLRDQIVKHLEDYYFDADIEEALDCAEELLDILIIPALKKKVKFCNEQLKEPTALIEECSYDCLNSKKDAFEEVIEMLKVKK